MANRAISINNEIENIVKYTGRIAVDELQYALDAIERGDKVKARTLLYEILKEDRNNESAWLLMSQVVDDQQKKLDCINRVLLINPRSGAAYDNLCLFYYRMAQYEKGLESGQKAIELIDSSTPLKSQATRYNNLSLCSFALGQTDEAIKYAQRASALDPNSLQIQKNLKSYMKKSGTKGRNTALLLIILLSTVFFLICRSCLSSAPDDRKPDIGKICTLYVDTAATSRTVLAPTDKEALDALVKAVNAQDDYASAQLVSSGRVIQVDNNVEVRVIDMALAVYEVRVLQGKAMGKSVWVPHEWLTLCREP